jgi:hypothetical protein
MSEIILHHYALSPYSEKVRLALGLASRKVAGRPDRRAVATARRPNQSPRGGVSTEVLPIGRFARIYFGSTPPRQTQG